MPVEHLGKGGFILAQTSWEEFRPWLRPAAVDWLASALPAGARVFEWGAGASTIWLARQGYEVLSCELDGGWYEVVRGELEKQGLAAQVYAFSRGGDHPQRLQEYADFILAQRLASFDLVLIDGRNRNRCLGNARPMVKIGGRVCLDNSERPEYAAGRALYDTWPGVEWGDEGWSTAIWQRPEGTVERLALENRDV